MNLLGIDVGTQGARALVCDPRGRVLAHAEERFSSASVPPLPSGWFEQDPADWWKTTVRCLRRVARLMREAGASVAGIAGISVTSTSGTVCAVDDRGVSLGRALMYNDQRAVAEAAEVNRVGAALREKMGYRFLASWALPKLLWLKRHSPEQFEAARYFLSPTDFITGRLTGSFGVTDYSNALKTGYDLVDERWPDFIEAELDVPCERLPRVVPPGTVIGGVSRRAADEAGLEAGTPVLAGMTDGCASQMSTGAVAPGQWSSTLGTTLVVKGVSCALVRDPLGRVYCHRHPDGHWLPGGASNTGGECISRRFDAARLDALNAQVLGCAPTELIVYPLVRLGERFPFARPQAHGFMLGDAADEATRYTAHLEGVAYVERLAYEVLESLGAEVGDQIYSAGGATGSPAWLQLRADVLDKSILVPLIGGGAMGAAIVAAGGTAYDGIIPAARAMVSIAEQIEPRPDLQAPYEERYARFCEACRERGYLEGARERGDRGTLDGEQGEGLG